MRKLLPIALLAMMVACKKNDDTRTSIKYTGKWFITQTVSKQYYTDTNGDTVFYRNETSTYADSTAYLEIKLTDYTTGKAVLYMNNQLDSLSYEYMTAEYFKLDSTLCVVTSLSDSAFQFNTLSYEGDVIPDKVLVSQDYFIMKK
ncbi:hypothetical protein SIO70_20840 [Chitinophaga sancti]|uniref:hypothetical protein n=1 Tax=Chitinophaga sancti TaxID=1004 RepID=UPI002A759DE7|nr:hypothetical protein [Chitinophaga sancti]WPQ60805.1 hypothetical protein SIO70_20840 [Chitinophaga sancti]